MTHSNLSLIRTDLILAGVVLVLWIIGELWGFWRTFRDVRADYPAARTELDAGKGQHRGGQRPAPASKPPLSSLPPAGRDRTEQFPAPRDTGLGIVRRPQ